MPASSESPAPTVLATLTVGGNACNGRCATEPVHAFCTVGNDHMLDALRLQARCRSNLRCKAADIAAQGIAEFFTVGLDQPGACRQPLLQGLAAGVQDHFQPHALKAQQQVVQPLRADAPGQTASHHDRVMPGGNAFKGVEQRLLRLCANLRPRPVKVGDAAVVFGQLDIAAGFAPARG
jgi:hypothetical protein